MENQLTSLTVTARVVTLLGKLELQITAIRTLLYASKDLDELQLEAAMCKDVQLQVSSSQVTHQLRWLSTLVHE